MNLPSFATSVSGEFVAGCLIATVEGKRQYLHRNGEFTQVGRRLYLAWEDSLPAELDVAIATEQPSPRRKFHKSVGRQQ